MEAQKFIVEDTFNLKGVKMPVTGFKPGHEHEDFVPAADPDYKFRKELLSDVLAWWEFGDTTPLYLVGPMGSGKTSVIKEIHARLNVPLHIITAHCRMEVPDMIGQHVIIDGDMMYVPGPLVNAMRYGHTLMIDEVDMLDPGTVAGLNGLREGQPIVIPENGGETVHPHPNFRLIVAGNTAGNGDETGLYQGTTRLNGAFLDGFWGIEVGYPERETELSLLSNILPKVDKRYLERLVDIAQETRDAFMGESDSGDAIEVTMSTRTLVRWANLTRVFAGVSQKGESPTKYALRRALTWRCEPTTREFIEGLVDRHFGE